MVRSSFGVLAVTALAILFGVLPATLVRAQGDPPPARVRCVQLQRIDHTEVIGDRNILFYMKDRNVYRNRLPQACPSLRQGRPFMYRVVLNQLCDTDVVTVLEPWGFGFTPTASCLLGPFDLIDKPAIEALKATEGKPK